MNFLTLIATLLLAHYRPIPMVMMASTWHAQVALALEKNLNDGKSRHGWIAWVLGVALPMLMVGGVNMTLRHFLSPLAVVWGMVVLYLMMDFRSYGNSVEAVISALRDNNIPMARKYQSMFEEKPVNDAYGASEISRVTIEETLIGAHYGVLAPIFWFVLLGPSGAVLYRLSYSLSHSWSAESNAFHQVAKKIFYWLDWLPARFTAMSFAIAGDFEDALYCWRSQAASWHDHAQGILLSSGAGALGVKLGEPLPVKGVLEFRPELGMGNAADGDYLMSAVGLIWRALVLMLALLLLMTFANWLGN